MKGDPGPFVEIDGPRVWVPRTVPYREAHAIARQAVQEMDQYPAYRGKTDAWLTGFARDCQCAEDCELRYDEDGNITSDYDACLVPAWAFEIVEKKAR